MFQIHNAVFVLCSLPIIASVDDAWSLYDFISYNKRVNPYVVTTNGITDLEKHRFEEIKLLLEEKRLRIEVQRNENEIRVKTFEQQLCFNVVILILVIIITLAGIGFTWVQMKETSTAQGQETSIEITRDGLKIRSSVIGLLILVVSLVFFYLYLIGVYKIEEVSTTDVTTMEHFS